MMFRLIRSIPLLLLLVAGQADAQSTGLQSRVDALGVGGFAKIEQAIGDLAATGDAAAVPVLEKLAAGKMYVRKSDQAVVMGERGDDGYVLTHPLTGEGLGEVGRQAVKKIRVNNKLRRVIRTALGGLTLMSPDAAMRRTAAESMFKSRSANALAILDQAIDAETDGEIRRAMEQARAATILGTDATEVDKLAAIEILKARGDRGALALLTTLAGTEEPVAVAAAAAAAVNVIEDRLALWGVGQNIWYGLSLGSVLLLAAIGLAITFGVMGVINMAHGEMVMLGAYTTFVVQEIIRSVAPDLIDASILIALPLAFLFTGAIGIAIEQGIIRFLYGRPLETLLATWGLSLILQQTIRSIFGPTNKEVSAPSWMSGAFELGQMQITYNRLCIIVFALAVFALLIFLLRSTSFGLSLRAVTQNRPMASAMGIRAPWVDAMTFGLGSGVAGLAGVAISQIDNVSPNLGQGYLIDSFMVVVFGGVGNLWGTLVGAITLGVTNKFLEPYVGAVLGKILVLVIIILFIQKRPRGLFALKGRAVET